MKNLIEKPYLTFLLSIPIIILIGILNENTVLDTNIYDTSIAIEITSWDSAIVTSVLFGIIGVGYLIMHKINKKLSKRLNWIHVVLTFGGILIVWILTKLYRTDLMEYEFNNSLTLIIILIILLIIVGQIIFPINIIYGLIKKGKIKPVANNGYK